MTGADPSLGFRRMLAALDPTMTAEPALAALADIADRLEAELELLLIEDSDLFRVAGLPLARQVDLRTGTAAPLGATDLEAQIQAVAARLRRRLAKLAAHKRLRWSFHTVRGDPAGELTLAAERADLLVLGRRSGPAAPAIAALRRSRRSVMLLSPEAGTPRSVVALYRGGATGRHVLATALRLAATERSPIEVVTADRKRAAAALKQIIAASPAAPRHRIVNLPADDGLAALVEHAAGGILVVGADEPLLQAESAWDLMSAAACSVLAVR
ncbi:MAG: universal stress protein [Inquilinus sp.]|nr:universal stress protein [Inquilinus sp.]